MRARQHGVQRTSESTHHLLELDGALEQPRLLVDDPRPQHSLRAETRTEVSRDRLRVLSTCAIRREKTELPASRRLDGDGLELDPDHATEVDALLERPAQRAQQRGGLRRRR